MNSDAVKSEGERKKDIGAMLKKHRKLNNLSVKQVASKLKEINICVAPKTIYGWESGNTQPDANTFLSLCDLYKVEDIMKECKYVIVEREQPSAAAREEELLRAYLSHPAMHEAIHKLLDMEP